jgi:hypothetical protein
LATDESSRMLTRRSFLIGGCGAGLLAEMARTQSAVRRVDVRIVPNARRLGVETVNIGLPLPPGLVSNPLQISVDDADDQEIDAAVRPLEVWRSGTQSLRAVQVQCDVDLSKGVERRIRVRIGDQRRRDRPSFVPVEATLVQADGLRGPRVLPVLPADWLCESRLAGPQTPASRSSRYSLYDRVVEASFARSLDYVASTDATHWLFDRTSSWYKAYIRTGDTKYLLAGYRAAHFVRSQTVADGPKAGTFRLRGQDLKYVYPRAMHLHYLLTGDPRALETGKLMAKYCLDHWDPRYRPGQPSGPNDDSGEHGHWTPRHQGIAMSGVLHGWEMTGDRVYWDKSREYVAACDELQNHPPDGRAPDGSWRINWAAYDPLEAKFEAGASAWMSAMLCDSLFHHWTVDKDVRIPTMIEAWCDFLDTHGLVPDGSKAYYVIDCFAKPGEAGGIVDDDMDQHNAELCHTFALGSFFTTAAAKKARFGSRIDRLLQEWSKTDLNSPPRAYNWSLQASGQMIYLLSHAPEDV